MTQADAPLAAALEQYNQQTKAVFTIPGHHRGAGASAWWADHKACGTFQFDVTETPRTDDLHAPEGAICQAQLLAAEACGADQAFFLSMGQPAESRRCCWPQQDRDRPYCFRATPTNQP